MLTVPTTSKNKDAAKEFINVALSVAGQKDLLKSEGLVVRQSAMDPNDPEVKAANPFIDAWREQMKWATPSPKWTAIGEVMNRITFGVNQAVTLVATPKQALDNVQKEVEALVK
jgi:maltose-binding protein MalE